MIKVLATLVLLPSMGLWGQGLPPFIQVPTFPAHAPKSSLSPKLLIKDINISYLKGSIKKRMLVSKSAPNFLGSYMIDRQVKFKHFTGANIFKKLETIGDGIIFFTRNEAQRAFYNNCNIPSRGLTAVTTSYRQYRFSLAGPSSFNLRDN